MSRLRITKHRRSTIAARGNTDGLSLIMFEGWVWMSGLVNECNQQRRDFWIGRKSLPSVYRATTGDWLFLNKSRNPSSPHCWILCNSSLDETTKSARRQSLCLLRTSASEIDLLGMPSHSKFPQWWANLLPIVSSNEIWVACSLECRIQI